MHPVIQEICRAKEPPVRLEVFRRWQQALRDDVQAKLDELDALKSKKKAKTEATCA